MLTPKFQGWRSDEAVRSSVGRLEIVLDAVADLAGHLGRVFLGSNHHKRSAHQPDIVIFLIGLLGNRRAVAVVASAGGIWGTVES